MPITRAIAALLLTLALGLPASAAAQTTTDPRGRADVSTTPPVPLSSGDPGSAPTPAAAAPGELPNTGSDPRVLFLWGVALTLVGVGLRLRTVDADLY